MSEQDQKRKPKRIDMRVGAHVAKPESEKLTPEQRAQISRENGAKNNGDKVRGISTSERAAIRHLNETRAADAATKLGESGFRIRGDIKGSEARDAAKTLGELALRRMTDAMMGRISKDKINATLKATIAMREEVCDPLVKEQKITGSLTLEQLVAQAAVKARESKG